MALNKDYMTTYITLYNIYIFTIILVVLACTSRVTSLAIALIGPSVYCASSAM